jgi:hypothetical protein
VPGLEKLELDSGIQQESRCKQAGKPSPDDGNSCLHWLCLGLSFAGWIPHRWFKVEASLRQGRGRADTASCALHMALM